MATQEQEAFRAKAIATLYAMSPEDVLARLLYGEIRNGDALAMFACAWSVLNRVAKPRWWGKTTIDVCLKNKQYSSFNADDPNLLKIMNPETHVLARCKWAAHGVLQGYVKDFTGRATHYITHAAFATTTPTHWARMLPMTYEDRYHKFFIEA